jgi:hypothetical protein
MVEYARERGITDRVLLKFEPPDPVFRGWRLATSIIVPTSSLRQPLPEKPLSRGTAVQWWAQSPDRGWSLCFNVYVSDRAPDCEEGISFDGTGEVGRIFLPGGGGVYIVADEVDYSTQQEGLARKGKRDRCSYSLEIDGYRSGDVNNSLSFLTHDAQELLMAPL